MEKIDLLTVVNLFAGIEGVDGIVASLYEDDTITIYACEAAVRDAVSDELDRVCDRDSLSREHVSVLCD